MSKIESGIRVVLEFNKAVNQHDLTSMVRLLSDDCIFEHADPPPEGTVYSGKEEIAHFWQDIFRESPQAHIKIEDIYGFGERCMMHWRYEWIDNTGEKRYIRGVDIYQIKDDHIKEIRSYVKGMVNFSS